MALDYFGFKYLDPSWTSEALNPLPGASSSPSQCLQIRGQLHWHHSMASAVQSICQTNAILLGATQRLQEYYHPSEARDMSRVLRVAPVLG